MIPSIFIVLDKLPLNGNGKIDRKLLPPHQFSTLTRVDQTDLLLLTPLEEHLRRIIIQAFHNESPDVNISFGQMGGTSLDTIRALSLILQEIYSKMDAGMLFANPTIRQLAMAIEPLLVVLDNLSSTTATLQFSRRSESTNAVVIYRNIRHFITGVSMAFSHLVGLSV